MNTVCKCAFYIPARLADRLRCAFNLIVALDSPGPAIFRQERLGLNGKPFMIYKFRTMRLDAEANGPRWAAVCDTRCTRFGQFLRRTRLDELPQLWNILRGDMSLVGPRPERAYFYREFETYMAMNIAKMLFPLLTLPYLTRVLSTDCYGSVVYVKSVTTYLQLLVDFGFVLSATKSIVQAREERARQERIMGDVLLVIFLMDDRIKTDEDIQQMLGLSVLASIPCAGGKKAGKYGCCRAYGAKERRPYQEKKRGAKAK